MKNLVLAVLLFFQVPGTSTVQRGTNTVSGRVQSAQSRPVAGIRVFAILENSAIAGNGSVIISAIAQTDSAGRYELQNLPTGTYFVAAGLLDSPTYYPGVTDRGAAQAVQLSGGAKATVDFVLDPVALDTLAELTEIPQNPGSIASTGQPVTASTKLKLRQVLQVEWGSVWWGAKVIELRPDGRVKIHYLGWSSSWDEVVPPSRLQLDDNVIEKIQRPAPALPTRLSFPPGIFLEFTEKGDVPADAGPIASTGRKVSADTKLEQNQVLQVEWGGMWWAVRVLDLLPADQVRVHYLGWSAGWDEVVPRSRLQLDDNAIEKTRQGPRRN